MKRLAAFAVFVGVVILAVRRLGGFDGTTIRAKCSEMCDRMLDQMPESFPPNRMMADLDDLKERTGQILDILEHQATD